MCATKMRSPVRAEALPGGRFRTLQPHGSTEWVVSTAATIPTCGLRLYARSVCWNRDEEHRSEPPLREQSVLRQRRGSATDGVGYVRMVDVDAANGEDARPCGARDSTK